MIVRIGLGATIALNGIGKLMGDVPGFVDKMGGKFTESFVPMWMIDPVLWIIPAAEVVIGLWLLSGIKRIGALLAFGIMMVVFAIGHLLMGDHNLTGIFVYLIATGLTLSLPARGCKTDS